MTMVLVTGANGFVGRAVCAGAAAHDMRVRGTVRAPASLSDGCESIIAGGIDGTTDWSAVLADCDCVIHLAARVHVMRDESSDPLAEFRRVNVEGTLNLARQAAQAGSRRFVFLSSVKVNGESTSRGKPFTADDAPSPQDAYGISKMEAEQGLMQIARQTGMEVVIIRPPLIYGPGVKANFASLMRWLGRGLPLPLGAVRDNRRSLVALDNLVDLIYTCVAHPAAANQIFLVSDDDDVSMADLLQRLGRAMARPARLIPVPPALLNLAALLLGKRDFAQRLLGSLQVDVSKTCALLGWRPPITLEEGLRRAVAGAMQ